MVRKAKPAAEKPPSDPVDDDDAEALSLLTLAQSLRAKGLEPYFVQLRRTMAQTG